MLDKTRGSQRTIPIPIKQCSGSSLITILIKTSYEDSGVVFLTSMPSLLMKLA